MDINYKLMDISQTFRIYIAKSSVTVSDAIKKKKTSQNDARSQKFRPQIASNFDTVSKQ